MTRHTRKSSRRKKRLSSHRVRGAGYSDGPNWIQGAPGNLVHNSFSGTQNNLSPLTDCTGNPMSHRPGFIPSGTDMSVRGGLPGMRGGKRRRKRGGAAIPPMASIDQFMDRPVYNSITPPPTSFPNPSGAGGSIAQPAQAGQQVIAVPPGGNVPAGAQMPPGASTQVVKQSGGRYGMFPGMGPLNASNGVGTSPGPFGRIPCEAGTYNPLNPNPNNIQRLTTAPLTPPYVTMRGGGANMAGSPIQAGSGGFSAANFPVVNVGAADSMRYYAPTAGYGHAFQTFRAPSPVPALMLNTPYDARAFNQACIKTGGGRTRTRRTRRTRGGAPVAFDAGKFAPVTMSQVDSRYDFDFSKKGLPVKFGGSRRKGKKRSTRRK